MDDLGISTWNERCKYCGENIEAIFYDLDKWGTGVCYDCLTSHVFIRGDDNQVRIFNYTVSKKIDDKSGYFFTYTINDESIVVENYVIGESGLPEYKGLVYTLDKYVDPDELFSKIEKLKVFL